MKSPRVLILCGGLGTRLSSVVKDVPKGMAPIAGKPFLEYQMEFLRKQGFGEFTLLTGHLSGSIEKHFGDGRKFGVQIDYSVEHSPLGTGGAIRQAMVASSAEKFLVLNGDCLFAADFKRFLKHARSPISLAVKYTKDLARYGSLTFDEKYQVTRFQEKSDIAAEGYINAGAYLFDRSALALLPEGKFSIETDVFVPLSTSGKLCAIPCGGRFVDIGTPESFAWAQNHLPAWLNELLRPCLFVDRDGVLVRHKHYLHQTEDVFLVPEMCEVVRLAKKQNWHVVVVTNQSGVGRGLFTLEQCDRANAHIDKLLTAEGAKPDLWMCSYDHPTEGQGIYRRDSLRRKPKPGMMLEACDLLSIDLERSLMIGDNSSDQIELPGLHTILVQGDFELKNIREGNQVTQNFAELKIAACARILKS
jgi:histidinol-phosphate phosphatase family protein